MEEDRERQKRLREETWIVKLPESSSLSQALNESSTIWDKIKAQDDYEFHRSWTKNTEKGLTKQDRARMAFYRYVYHKTSTVLAGVFLYRGVIKLTVY
jgi:hypothetical protein